MAGPLSQAPRHPTGRSVNIPSAVVSAQLHTQASASGGRRSSPHPVTQQLTLSQTMITCLPTGCGTPGRRRWRCRPPRPRSSRARPPRRATASSDTQPRLSWTIMSASETAPALVLVVRRPPPRSAAFPLSLSMSSRSLTCRCPPGRSRCSPGWPPGPTPSARGTSWAPSGCGQRTACGCACGSSWSRRRSPGSRRGCPWSPPTTNVASPGGITGPQLTPRKWLMSVSMSCIVRSLRGGVARGWSDLYGPAGMLFEALLDDAQALAHLLHVHGQPVVGVAVHRRGDVELELLVAAVRPLLAEVPARRRCRGGTGPWRPTRWPPARSPRRCPRCAALTMRFFMTARVVVPEPLAHVGR